MTASDWYSWEGSALILKLRVQPGTGRDGFAGIHGQQLKIRLAAPPVDGAANRRLLKFLAKSCGVPASRVVLLSGDSSRNKRVRVETPRTLPPGVERPDCAS